MSYDQCDLTLISNWGTPRIANWFYNRISTFFMITEQVVPCVNPKGHTCSTSPDLCYPRARIENSPQVKERVESINPMSEKERILHVLISKVIKDAKR